MRLKLQCSSAIVQNRFLNWEWMVACYTSQQLKNNTPLIYLKGHARTKRGAEKQLNKIVKLWQHGYDPTTNTTRKKQQWMK